MVDTPVVFLDEFSTGMDPLLKRAVMDALRDEAKRGRTIVLTTQILSEAEELCDDILIINHGRQVARGDLHSLKLLSQGVYEVTLTFDRVPDGHRATSCARGPRIRSHVSGNTVELALKEDEQQCSRLVSELAKRGPRAARSSSAAPASKTCSSSSRASRDAPDVTRRCTRSLAVMYREGKIRATNVTFIFWDLFYPLGYLLVFGVGMNDTLGLRAAMPASTTTRSSWRACSAWRASASRRTPRGRSSWTATTASSTRC